ncbi:MAG: PAC2 family protein, partial [Acidimicrobiia bacterium]
MSFFERRADVALNRPVLVMSLEGWVDAGFGAATASAAIVNSLETRVVGVFDTDALLDHRARRPLVRVVDGVNAGLTWPTLTLRAATDPSGNDLLLLFGPEPDHHWKAFTDEVVSIARSFGVRLVVGLGAFPAPAPHTRPVRLTTTATSADLAAQVGFMH